MSKVTVEKFIFAEDGAKEGLRRSIVETCVQVHADAVSSCPVDLGQLANSLMWKVGQEEGGFNEESGETAPSGQKLNIPVPATVGIVGTNSDHWYPEFGTRYQPAKPFLRPAGEIASGASVAEVVAKYSREEMEKAFAKRKKEVTNG